MPQTAANIEVLCFEHLFIQLMYKFKFPDEKIFFQNKKFHSAVLSFKVKKGPKNKDFQKKSAKKVK